MEKLKYIKSYVKGIKESQDRTVIVNAVASTSEKDRDGEVIKAEGWDLGEFKNAPRLLWSHNAMQLPIGKVLNIGIKSGQLIFDAVFAEKEDEFAAKVAKMFKGGFLNTFSVGFMPLEENDGVISKQKLLEISAVNIPANPGAMVQHSYKSFVKDLENMEKQQSTKVQTLILSKKSFKTVGEAKKWVIEHDYHAAKVDETEDSFRFRQMEPSMCQENSFRTIELASGVSAVICKPTEKGTCAFKGEGEKELKDEDFKLILTNQIAILKETTNTLEKYLKEIKSSRGDIKKVETQQKKPNRLLSALKIIDRAVEYAIRQEKRGGVK